MYKNIFIYSRLVRGKFYENKERMVARMINLAVIELKDILKYLIKITLLIVVVVGLTKYFSSFSYPWSHQLKYCV